jgi:hypothetical protein
MTPLEAAINLKYAILVMQAKFGGTPLLQPHEPMPHGSAPYGGGGWPKLAYTLDVRKIEDSVRTLCKAAGLK